VADTGVHGANRLASNGVTEGLVAGRAVAERLVAELPVSGAPQPGDGLLRAVDASGREPLTRAMSRWVGPLRDADGLREAERACAAVPRAETLATLDEVEATNLATVSRLVVRAAAVREESRGSHRRLDHPETSEAWRGRIVQQWDGAVHRHWLERVAT
jgi:L-aspartate oxidase